MRRSRELILLCARHPPMAPAPSALVLRHRPFPVPVLSSKGDEEVGLRDKPRQQAKQTQEAKCWDCTRLVEVKPRGL